MTFQSMRTMDLSGKRVLLRADLNVPAHGGKVTDTTRIDRLEPTIAFLRKAGAKVLVLSHFGRPDGEKNPQMSLAFLIPVLEKSWNAPVKFAQDCIGTAAESLAANLQAGEVGILENVRFHKGEEANDPEFTRKLAALGDIYINDAFSAAHRAHASTEGLAHLLPCAPGLLMEEELNALGAALGTPQKPVAAVAGGSKISTKLAILNNLVEKVDFLILGGGMANTFSYADGGNVGASLCEKEMADEARAIMQKARARGCRIVLPKDSIAVAEISGAAERTVAPGNAIPDGLMAIDIGPQGIEEIAGILEQCKTLVWNGPMGVFEIKPFDTGTNALAQKAAALTKAGKLVSIAGGGDTVSALENAGTREDFTYISTAGGAFLEWLEGRTLPGVAALEHGAKAA